MKALRYSDAKGLRVEEVPIPSPGPDECLVKIIRAGICSTDLEIIRGYVPGFDHTLGHEFVGVVAQVHPGSVSHPSVLGQRVVGEINCRTCPCEHPDPIFVRNHAPDRTVLGIIGKDGCMAEYVTLPIENLHVVPDDITDAEACFCEPLAAACRIIEQSILLGTPPLPSNSPSNRTFIVGVIGDGKLGILVAHVLAQHVRDTTNHLESQVVFFGHHAHKVNLVRGVVPVVIPSKQSSGDGSGENDELEHIENTYTSTFDVIVEATGSPEGILMALKFCRPLGTIVQKSTCSVVVKDPSKMPVWSTVANDIVVNEKKLVGSRCGPFPPALELLRDGGTKELVRRMIDVEKRFSSGAVEAIEEAQRKGRLKVQLVMQE